MTPECSISTNSLAFQRGKNGTDALVFEKQKRLRDTYGTFPSSEPLAANNGYPTEPNKAGRCCPDCKRSEMLMVNPSLPESVFWPTAPCRGGERAILPLHSPAFLALQIRRPHQQVKVDASAFIRPALISKHNSPWCQHLLPVQGHLIEFNSTFFVAYMCPILGERVVFDAQTRCVCHF